MITSWPLRRRRLRHGSVSMPQASSATLRISRAVGNGRVSSAVRPPRSTPPSTPPPIRPWSADRWMTPMANPQVGWPSLIYSSRFGWLMIIDPILIHLFGKLCWYNGLIMRISSGNRIGKQWKRKKEERRESIFDVDDMTHLSKKRKEKVKGKKMVRCDLVFNSGISSLLSRDIKAEPSYVLCQLNRQPSGYSSTRTNIWTLGSSVTTEMYRARLVKKMPTELSLTGKPTF